MKRSASGRSHASVPGDAIKTAMMFHQRGEFAEARKRYRAILKADPGLFDVLHGLGVLELQEGRLNDAQALIFRAVQICPTSAEAHLNLGNALKALNRPEAALGSYERALSCRPDYAEAHNNRGNVLLDLRRYAEALSSYDRALQAAPDYVDAEFNRAVALQSLGRIDDALAAYELVLVKAPDHADAWVNRGILLQELKRPEAALESYDRALAINPSIAEALNNRGNALRDLERYDEALESYNRALMHAPGYAEAYFNRGAFFQKFKRRKEEMDNYDQALKCQPDHAGALYMRGLALQQINRNDESIRDFDHLLSLGVTGAEYEDTIGNRFYSCLRACNWRDYQEQRQRIFSATLKGQHAMPPFAFLAISDLAGDQRECARLWCEDKYPAGEAVWNGERYEHDRIRVAYLSSDFRDHAVAQLTAELFERHDRSRFEVIAIAFGAATGGEMRTRLERAFDRFIDVRQKSDEEVARLLRELEVDIAVDLNGYTMDCRTGILARRGAPVQVNYLGYPGTMAAPYMDYIIADHVVIPEQDQEYYTEKIAYMPDTYLANDATRRISDQTPSRIEAGLPERGFVFCSFNRSYKITPRVFEVWMRLLKQVEGSVLWLSENNAQAMSNLRREAVARGVAPERLVFAGRVEDNADHLSRQRLADLFLDTLPYNAHTTAADALWAGLPVLTCVGTTFAGRVAASVLKAIGLPELITHTLEDYEALALKLAADGQLLSGIRHKLADHRGTHALFDSDRFRRHIEAAYQTMWQRHQHELPPHTFNIASVA